MSEDTDMAIGHLRADVKQLRDCLREFREASNELIVSRKAPKHSVRYSEMARRWDHATHAARKLLEEELS